MSITSLNPQNQQLASAMSQQGSSLSQSASGSLSGSTYIYPGSQLGQAGVTYPGLGSPGSIYQSPYYGYTSSIYTEPDIALRKVENGWILKMKGKEYILNGTDKVEKYLKLFLE